MTNNRDLPKGWASATISDVCKKPQYGWTSKASQIGTLKYLRTTDITSGQITWDTVPYCLNEPDDIAKYLLEDGDVVISRAGSVGYSKLIKKPPKAVFASYLIRFNPLIEQRFFAYFLKSPSYWQAISEKKLGIAVQNVNATKLKEISIPIAPLGEQERIVGKIEELFSDLDAGVAALEKVKKEITRFRQAVLKNAFEGKLTAKWRKENKEKIEPASKLLERIAKEREKQTKGRKQRKLPLLDTSTLPKLPEGWAWGRVNDITVSQQYGTSDKATIEPSGTPVLRMGNIQDGKLVYDKLKFFPSEYADMQKFILKDGDVLFNRTNSAELVGKCAVYKSCCPPSIFASYLIKVETISSYSPDILADYINSIHGRKYINSVVSQQVGQANVNGTKLSMMPIPIFCQEEQEQIVSEIERRFSIADKAEAIAEQALKQASRLGQSILKKAFEGKLVPQNANDEPAEVLLERIRQQREQQQTKIKAKKKVKPKTAKIIKRKHSRGIYFRRGAVVSYIVDHLCDNSTFGRTQLGKMAHLTQCHLGIDLEFEFVKQAAGPFDEEIIKVESLASKQGWFKTYKRRGSYGYYYKRGKDINERCKAAVGILGDQKDEMDRLISIFKKMNTDQAELFDTIYAVWNDLLIDGIKPTENKIKKDFYAWSEEKKRFTLKQIHSCIEWIKDNALVPSGTGKKTQAI